jgi:hypothetical protein
VGIGTTNPRVGRLTIDAVTFIASNNVSLCPSFQLTVTDSQGLAQTAAINGPSSQVVSDSGGGFKCKGFHAFSGQSGTYTVSSNLGGTGMAMLAPDTTTAFEFCSMAGCPKPPPPTPPSMPPGTINATLFLDTSATTTRCGGTQFTLDGGSLRNVTGNFTAQGQKPGFLRCRFDTSWSNVPAGNHTVCAFSGTPLCKAVNLAAGNFANVVIP